MYLTKAGCKVSSVYVDINSVFRVFFCNCLVSLSLSSSEVCLWDNLMDVIRAHQNICWFLLRISLWGVWRGLRLICTELFVDRPWIEFAVLWLSSIALGYRDHFKKQWQPNPAETTKLYEVILIQHQKRHQTTMKIIKFEVTVNALALWIWRPFIC